MYVHLKSKYNRQAFNICIIRHTNQYCYSNVPNAELWKKTIIKMGNKSLILLEQSNGCQDLRFLE